MVIILLGIAKILRVRAIPYTVLYVTSSNTDVTCNIMRIVLSDRRFCQLFFWCLYHVAHRHTQNITSLIVRLNSPDVGLAGTTN